MTLRYAISVTNWSHQDVILLGNRVFRDVISKHEVILDQDGSWIPGVSMYKKRRHTEAQTQRDGHVMTEAAMGEMRPRAKERQEPPAAGRGRKDSFLSPSEGAWPANVLTATSGLQKGEAINLRCLKPPSVW